MGKYIKVGTITSTHGIKGEVKIFGDNPCFNTSFKDALYIDEKLMVEVHIKSVKNQNGKLIISFKEFTFTVSDMVSKLKLNVKPTIFGKSIKF